MTWPDHLFTKIIVENQSEHWIWTFDISPFTETGRITEQVNGKLLNMKKIADKVDLYRKSHNTLINVMELIKCNITFAPLPSVAGVQINQQLDPN